MVQALGTFQNSAGETYKVRGLSPLLLEQLRSAILKEWEDLHKCPVVQKPTYEVIVAGGDIEIHEHDETTLYVEGDEQLTEQNRTRWKAFNDCMREIDGEYNARMMRAVFSAVECTPTKEWREEMEFLGIPVPTEKSAEKYEYVKTRVLQSTEDVARLMTSVLRLAGMISEADVATAEATFQHIMEKEIASAAKTE